MGQRGSEEGTGGGAEKPRRRKGQENAEADAAPPVDEARSDPPARQPEPKSPFIRRQFYGSGS